MAFGRNPRALLIAADMWSGATAGDAHVPTFLLYADGYVVRAGQRADLATGLDAQVIVGHLSDAEIQGLLAFIRDRGFFALNSYYEPRPAPSGLATAEITVYLDKAKTARVYGPGFSGTPQQFFDSFLRITQTVPADSKPYYPTDGYLVATPAGSPSDFRSVGGLNDWGIRTGVRLADAVDGITVSGTTFSSVATRVAEYYPNALYREGGNAFRVRFVPYLPRAVFLTDWIGPIERATREFEGRAFDLVGYYRGANLLGEATGSPSSKSDWVIRDRSGAMFVSGAVPAGLDPNSRSDVWTVVRLRAEVVYVRNGTSRLQARRVDIASSASTGTLLPSSTPIADADAGIRAAKSRYHELSNIVPAKAMIRTAADVVFSDGSKDCPSVCIDNRFVYVAVKNVGSTSNVSEFSRAFDSASNSFDIAGTSLWGVRH